MIADISRPQLGSVGKNMPTCFRPITVRILADLFFSLIQRPGTFFPFCVTIWNNLDPKITNLPKVSSFKSTLLKFIRPNDASVYSVHEPLGVVSLTRLRVGFSHLREHKFRHNFADINDTFCSCIGYE